MPDIRSRPGLIAFVERLPPGLKDYFIELPRLLRADFSLEVGLAYVFARLELAHNRCLYCGVVKLHKVNAELAWVAIKNFYMTRDTFRAQYAVIYGAALPTAALEPIKRAESVRDNVLHGKEGTEAQKRNAIADVLTYAGKLNDHVVSRNGPRPCGDLRGFSGAGQMLEKGPNRRHFSTI
jgi:hypothetical protein